MTICSACGSELSDWEMHVGQALGVAACWCAGVPLGASRTLGGVAYATLCDPVLTRPVKIHDVLRLVGPHYPGDPRASINVALSQDRRFCWGGRALYGLARHGLIPGARSLAEAAYAVLLVAPRQLHVEEVDFVLEQLNYRFNFESLLHHLRGYIANRWGLQFNLDTSNRVWVYSGRNKRHEFNSWVRVSPSHARFEAWLECNLGPRVTQALNDRAERLAEVSDSGVELAGDRIDFR